MSIETGRGPVSAVVVRPEGARATVVVAHGAGGSMDSTIIKGFTGCLNEAGVSSVRFNFPYVEQGRRSPDPAPRLVQAYGAVFESARDVARGKPLFVGGKSLGGRIASLAVAEGLPAAGLVFLGYPLHAPGRTDRLRDEHLGRIRAPMLFLQGTDDPFARFDLLQQVVERLGRWALLHPVHGGDHSFKVKGEPRSERETGRLLGSVVLRFLQGVEG